MRATGRGQHWQLTGQVFRKNQSFKIVLFSGSSGYLVEVCALLRLGNWREGGVTAVKSLLAMNDTHRYRGTSLIRKRPPP